ncbi:LysR family transcriptional regulator [Streptomyces fumanus]|uniref:LysR family transcriptional regulator n=1 Tax=Streptomyces fumanus TaxID=67302 RepID=A0A919E8A0_9ACTN|nr:LysR family transcriptional regulator [Streptomyces fumanus]GHF22748.1 LysR family transcriptional regulator [Streptomyces fumanus]
MDLRQIRYFLAVARERNFTRAAQRLAMTQPALSRAIRSLEHTVGADLFVRTPRSVELTDVGRVLAAEVTGLDTRAANALREARRAARDTGRPLRLAVRGCDGALAGRLVEQCAARAPGQKVELVLTDPVAQPAAVRSGACDLALIRAPFDAWELESETWLTEPRVAVVAAGHPLADRTEVSLADLAGEPVVMGPVASERERAYWAGADLEDRPWREGPAVRDSLEILAAVAFGQAIAFVPRSMLPPQASTGGVAVLRVRDLSPSSLRLTWHEPSVSRAVAHFVRHALEVSGTVAAEHGATTGEAVDAACCAAPAVRGKDREGA